MSTTTIIPPLLRIDGKRQRGRAHAPGGKSRDARALNERVDDGTATAALQQTIKAVAAVAPEENA